MAHKTHSIDLASKPNLLPAHWFQNRSCWSVSSSVNCFRLGRVSSELRVFALSRADGAGVGG